MCADVRGDFPLGELADGVAEEGLILGEGGEGRDGFEVLGHGDRVMRMVFSCQRSAFRKNRRQRQWEGSASLRSLPEKEMPWKVEGR